MTKYGKHIQKNLKVLNLSFTIPPFMVTLDASKVDKNAKVNSKFAQRLSILLEKVIFDACRFPSVEFFRPEEKDPLFSYCYNRKTTSQFTLRQLQMRRTRQALKLSASLITIGEEFVCSTNCTVQLLSDQLCPLQTSSTLIP